MEVKVEVVSCSIFVRSKSLRLVAEAVKEVCEGLCINDEVEIVEGKIGITPHLRKVVLRGENVENPLEEKYAIDVYVDFDGRPQMLFSIATINEEIKAIYLTKDISDVEYRTKYTAADFVHDVIETLLEKFGWDNVKWLFIP